MLPAMRRSLSLLAVGLCLVACDADPSVVAAPEPTSTAASTPKPDPKPATREKVALKQTKFGDPITEASETALTDIAKNPAAFADKTIRTSGVVQSVCQSAGCWMEIGDPEQRAHIKMAGHSFLVPKNCHGHRAVIQGTVKGGEPVNECGKKDGCGGEENGAVAKLEIVATGVEFID